MNTLFRFVYQTIRTGFLYATQSVFARDSGTANGSPAFAIVFLLCLCCTNPAPASQEETDPGRLPLGRPGLKAVYRIAENRTYPDTVITTYSVQLGSVEERSGVPCQWLHLKSTKASGEAFRVWLLTSRYPSFTLEEARHTVARYLVQEGDGEAVEYRHKVTGDAVLPCLGGWNYLIPHASNGEDLHPEFPEETDYLGHRYRLETRERSALEPVPGHPLVLELLPDVLVGVPHNTRQKDETRRWDESDYEYIRLTRENYAEMIDAGMNCFFVDAEQAGWIGNRGVFYWGIGGQDIRFPEDLYRSNYLGPLLFLDEPAVCTRDYVIRPRLKEDAEYRKELTPQIAFQEFQKYFAEARNEKNPTRLIQELKARADVDLGDMTFLQSNLYTWETMESTAAYQLSRDPAQPPASFVFEPPGHLGTLRTLPEMNMAYQCQIPVDNPKHFISIVYGFLRGAARNADKEWGTSIYGGVDRSDAFWFFTHAYDLGARMFFFWDNSKLACVPYSECLAISRSLKAHRESHPFRNEEQLKHAAEVAILLPPGYTLGHVHMGKGLLWGLGELNLERKNQKGVLYRTVMGNFFTEIERCIRLGIAFDLLWDLPDLRLDGYREVVRIREDGRVEIAAGGKSETRPGPRVPIRPEGIAPELDIRLSTVSGKAPLQITAHAELRELSAPVYYTPGPDSNGVYHNIKVFWELYGPGEEDYRTLTGRTQPPPLHRIAGKTAIDLAFQIPQAGRYRLRAAACDLAGRTTVVWKDFTVDE